MHFSDLWQRKDLRDAELVRISGGSREVHKDVGVEGSPLGFLRKDLISWDLGGTGLLRISFERG